MLQNPFRTLAAAAITLLMTPLLSGCLVAGVSSSGHFFLFPSVGVLFVILILFLLLRRR